MPVTISPETTAEKMSAGESKTSSRDPASQSATAPSSSRRIVKAKAPPPVDVADSLTPSNLSDDDDSPLRASVVPALKSPSLNRELEQETSDRWRQERRQANAVIQRSQRDKEVQQRRQQAPPPSELVAKPHSRVPMEVPAALSVEPQFPEHKRSGDTAALDEVGEPSEKRRKASLDESDEAADGSSFRIGATGTVVAMAVLAVAAAIAFRRARV